MVLSSRSKIVTIFYCKFWIGFAGVFPIYVFGTTTGKCKSNQIGQQVRHIWYKKQKLLKYMLVDYES